MLRRNTKQREHILEAITRLGHATFDDIVHYLKKHELDVSIVTIYRNLSFLEKEQKIRLVEISGKNVYETSKYAHHYHFNCNECGAIYDIDKDYIVISYPHPEHLHNYQIDEVDILLKGRCPKCSKK